MDRRKSPNGQTEVASGDGETQHVPNADAGGALAPADPDADWSSARQSLDIHGRAHRRGLCPTHNRVSGRFVGVNAQGWVFSCAVGAHNFVVAPDPTAPKTAYEAAAAAAWAWSKPHS